MKPRRRPSSQPGLFDSADQAELPIEPPAPPRIGRYAVPAHPKIEHCRSCGREIIWIKTSAGRAMPLSVATVETEEDGARTALAHFTDCPQGKEWSKR